KAAINGTAISPNAIEVLRGASSQSKIKVALTDTIRKGGFFFSTNAKTDSVNYVINGVKSTKADLLKLDEKTIESVQVFSADAATKVMKNLDNRYGTIFITTHNSETGKKFKEKLDGVTYTVSSSAGVKNSAGTTLKGDLIVLSSSGGSGTSNNEINADTIWVRSTPGSHAKIQLLNSSKNATLYKTIAGQNQLYYKSAKPMKAYSNKTYGDTSSNGITYNLMSDNASSSNNDPVIVQGYGNSKYKVQGNATLWAPNRNSVSSIDHISDKMIIINGKIASQADLKKISAFDIDRMVFKNDEETKELYGDKAKNGIVFIVTRKGAK
ncbi:MAG: hypothetical protein ABIN13_00860, partial [Mucilaginibacter sp.]